MLKLTYTETDFQMECLVQSLEEWVALRGALALRVGQKLIVEPSTASFLLPSDLPGINLLESAHSRLKAEAIAFGVCDLEYVEVSLQGTWIASDPESAEGVFVVAISDRTEFFLFNLWQDAQTKSAVVSE